MTTKTTSTAPGNQGGETRRPQAGDTVDVCGTSETGEVILAKVIVVSEANVARPWFRASTGENTYGRFNADEGKWWRWPATQGAVVAGPARICSCCADARTGTEGDCECPEWCPIGGSGDYIERGGQHIDKRTRKSRTPPSPAVAGSERFVCANCGADFRHLKNLAEHMRAGHESSQPASEPPGDACVLCAIPCSSQYSMSMAGVHRLCWTCALIEPEDARRIHARITAATAAKAALEAKLAEALTLVAPFGGGELLLGLRHLQRSLEREIEEHQRHHNNEDALRAELAAERAAHEATREALQACVDEQNGERRERDALAAQLKAMREALVDVAGRLESASALLEQEGLGGPDEQHTPAGDVEAIARARAALAASGPGEGVK